MTPTYGFQKVLENFKLPKILSDYAQHNVDLWET